MGAIANERQIRLLQVLLKGGIPLLEATTLIAEDSGNSAWKDATRRIQEGASLADGIPGLPPSLKPILRWGEHSGSFVADLSHVLDFWKRPLDRRVPYFFLSRATQDWTLGEALRKAPEIAALHSQWATLAAASDLPAAIRTCTALFPAPLERAVAEGATHGFLPKVFASLVRGCDAGLISFDGCGDRASSIRHGLYSLALLFESGHDLKTSLPATVPAIRDEATRKQFAALTADAFGEEPMGFLSAPAMALVRRAVRAGDLAKTLEYVATNLVE